MVRAAAAAFPAWRRTPPEDRIQYLFKLKQLLEERVDDLARICTLENGKTLTESRAELRRAIENVEVACGIPTLMQGYNLEDVASGIDETMIRQPLGVTAAIAPFNFPAMIPFWFLPYAIACGNTFILKPSEKVPLTAQRIFELLEELKLPAGVVNLVHGDRNRGRGAARSSRRACDQFRGVHRRWPDIFTRERRCSGKRVQCQGGAKNHVLVLPDADLETATRIISDGAFGCAGQRCLAVSVAVTVGEARKKFTEEIAAIAEAMRVGNGLDESVQMGPVITSAKAKRASRASSPKAPAKARRCCSTAGMATEQRLAGPGSGNFLRPTLLDQVPAESALSSTEIFGPVLSLIHAADSRGGNRDPVAQPVRQHGLHLHHQRRGRAQVPLRSARGKHGSQYRRGCSDGLFPVQRMGRQLLWRSARAGARRRRVLHG